MPPPPALTPDLMTIFFMGFSFPEVVSCIAGSVQPPPMSQPPSPAFTPDLMTTRICFISSLSFRK